MMSRTHWRDMTYLRMLNTDIFEVVKEFCETGGLFCKGLDVREGKAHIV